MSAEALQAWATVGQVAAPLVAAGAAWLSYLAVRALSKQTKASVLLLCLGAYVDVRKGRTKALREASADLCFDYYRELFDLHWTEFQLWKAGMIEPHVMKAWLDVRHRNHGKDDALDFKDAAGQHKVTYREVWAKLIDEYFAPSDPFVQFMRLVHDGDIKEAMKL
jgi:hypothetical protein